MSYNTSIQWRYNFMIFTLLNLLKMLTTTNQNLVFTDQMPDLKVIDFLKSIFSMFNLTAFLNFNNEIVVKTLDDFYNGGDTHDITEYVKTNEHTVGATVPFNEIDLEYAEPKTICATIF